MHSIVAALELNIAAFIILTEGQLGTLGLTGSRKHTFEKIPIILRFHLVGKLRKLCTLEKFREQAAR